MLTITIVIAIIIFLYKKNEQIKKNNYRMINKFCNIPKRIQYANLGSSHGVCSFIYNGWECCNEHCFNFALDSQTLYFDLKILKKHINKFNKKAKLFIVISYFSFTSKEVWEQGDEYKYLQLLSEKSENSWEYYIYKRFPVILKLKKIKKINSQRNKKKKREKLSKEELGEKRAFNHSKTIENGIGNLKKNIKIISEIIDLAKDNYVTPILITTPFYNAYIKNFDKEVIIKYFNEPVEEIRKKYEIEYINFNSLARFTDNEEFFTDADHLSKKGAEEFMKTLKNYLLGGKFE